MPSVDDRIVRIVFDNSSFERNVQTSLNTIKSLEKALQLEGAQKGLENVSTAAGHFDISNIGRGVDAIASKFTAMGAVGFSVIQSLTQAALGMVKKIGGDLLGPIISGGKQRAQNIDNAKFQFRSLGIDVDKAMASSLAAVKGTAFGLDEAAKAAGQFGASGLDAGADMTQALRGIAGAAALTNRSFGEIADIFTSSAATGIVNNQDLQQFATRGLNATAALSKQLHISENDVKQMASDGKLSFAIFSKAMDDAFGKQATKANETFQGSLANMRAALSRLGASFFTTGLTQARDLFNALSPTIDKITTALTPLIHAFLLITGFIDILIVKSLGKLDFSGLMFLAKIVGGTLVRVFAIFAQILFTVKKAFTDIFPGSIMDRIIRIAAAIDKFSKKLILSRSGVMALQRVFRIFFSILSIGWTVIKEGTKFILSLVHSLSGSFGPGFLQFISNISKFFTDLEKSLVKGGGIKDFFANLTDTMQGVMAFIKPFISAFVGLFSNFDLTKPLDTIIKFKDALIDLFTGADPKVGDAVGASLGRVSDRISTLKTVIERIKDVWAPFGTALRKIGDILEGVFRVISDWFKELGQRIADTMQKGDFDAMFDGLNTLLLTGIAGLLAKWVHGGIKLDPLGGIFKSLSGTFDQLTGVLKAMQAQIKANTLMKIAEAIAVLTGSVLVLSLIDSAALTKALAAMSIGFGQLIGSFALLNLITSDTKSAAQFGIVSTGMILLATGILLLTASVKIFSSMSWEDLAKGLFGVATLLSLVLSAVETLSNVETIADLVAVGAGLILIGIALNILGGAVKIFASMSLGDMVKGLIGVATALTIIGFAVALMTPEIPLLGPMGVGLIGIGTAMIILAGAVKAFSTMSWEDLAKGFIAMALGLTVIGTALAVLSEFIPLLPIMGFGLILVSTSMVILAEAMKEFGGMSWGDIAKGMVAMGGGLLAIGLGLTGMGAALPGVLALAIVVPSLKSLAKILKTFSSMSLGDIFDALKGLALALGGLALISVLISPFILSMIGLGIALTVIGVGFAFAGVGAYLFAKAFETLGKSGAAGAKGLVEALKSIGEAIPAFTTGLAKGTINYIKTIAEGAGPIMKAIGALLDQIIETVIKLTPKIVKALAGFIDGFVVLIYTKGPELIAAGLFLLITFLQGIRDNIEEITTLVGEIITKFLDAFNEQLPPIVQKLVDVFVTFLTSVAEGLGEISGTLLIGVGIAFLQGFFTGIFQAIGPIASWFLSFGSTVLGWIGDMLGTLWSKGNDLILGLHNGIDSAIAAVFSFFTGLGGTILEKIGDFLSTLKQKGLDIIGGFLTGIKEKFTEVIKWFGDLAGNIISTIFGNMVGGPLNFLWSLGADIIQGLWNGITSIWGKFTDWLWDKVKSLPSILRDFLGANSPSTVMMAIGEDTMLGFWIGMENQFDPIQKSLTDFSRSLSNMDDFNPTITPVLDLTQVQNEATKLSSILSDQTLTPTISLSNANAISSATNAQLETTTPESTITPRQVQFNQTINAPKQLSTVDIYKQTRNQITMAKEELSIP